MEISFCIVYGVACFAHILLVSLIYPECEHSETSLFPVYKQLYFIGKVVDSVCELYFLYEWLPSIFPV